MSDATSSGIPVDRYPGPVCSYTVDDDPQIRRNNNSFENRFGTVQSSISIVALFEKLGLEPRGDVDISDVDPTETAQFVVDTPPGEGPDDPTTYTVQQIPPTADEVGYLLFVAHTPRQHRPQLGVDHVASVVSHDLRNPLDVAKARLEAGRELDDDKHFDHVSQAHERMERIIQDVLTLARGEDVVNPDEEVNLRAVAESAWRTVETDGTRLQIEDTLPTVIADPDRIGRLFENLFRNAVEHGSPNSHSRPSETATESVTVRVGPLAGSDGFYIEDDGPGIPPEEQELVLKPGYTSEAHGTGLGLAIVARIVDLHDWSLAVTDGTDGGARFEITDIG